MNKKFCLGLLLATVSVTAHAGMDAASISQGHLLLTLMSFFGIGILLAFTPCVLPMVPILSAILVGQEKKNTSQAFGLSLIFVLSMSVTYAFAGLLAGYLGSTLQTLMQQPWIIISFSMIFVVMALSMFGWFNLTLPSFLQSKLHNTNQLLKSGNYLGVAAMGVLSTLIASPCVTAPLVSVLTYISQTGSATQGGLILFSLALGMGLPLIIFGMGQATLLPKTGMWMNNIKTLFGVMMLGLAIWMVSRILPGNVTLFLWSSLLIVSSVALGALNLNGENKLSPVWHGISILVLSYGILLLVGAASGNQSLQHPLQIEQSNEVVDTPRTTSSLFTYVQTLPALDKKVQAAAVAHKPVMIEFFATWCPDCKEVDANVLSSSEIRKKMKSFATIRVDVSERNPQLAEIMEKYNVLGVPTMIFYDKQGRLFNAEQLNNGITKENLLATLEQLS